MAKGYLQFKLITILILLSAASFCQENTKSYLLLENNELKFKHIFKEKRKITVWINDSISYTGFFQIQDSSFIKLDDTLVHIDSVVRLQGKNKRRSIAAPFVIITPVITGLTLEVILLFYDDSFFSYFPLPTFSGVGGTIIGTIVAVSFMDKETYEINKGDLQIVN